MSKNIFSSQSEFPDLDSYFDYNETNVLIGANQYALNKSQTKFVSIGLAYDLNFQPALRFFGKKNNSLILTEQQFNNFMNYKEVITRYLISGTEEKDIQENNFSIKFTKFKNVPVIVLIKNFDCIYLGSETITCLMEILHIIQCRIDYLRNQQFLSFFNIIKNLLQKQNGDVLLNVANLLKSDKNLILEKNSENLCLLYELLYLYPLIFKRKINEDS